MKTLLLVIFLFFSLNAFSQFVNFSWAKSLDRRQGSSFDETYLIGVDALKNVYLAGNFRNTMDVDPGPGVFDLTAPLDNMFVCKLDPDGNFIWGKQIGGDRFTLLKSLYVDLSGNVFTTGYFSGTADFDPGPSVYNLSATYSTGTVDNAIFISKLDKDGNFKWAKKIGGNNTVYTGFGITGDKFGNIITTGYIVGVTDMDPNSGTDNQGANGVVNAFIEKLDSLGNYKFGKVLNGNQDAKGGFIKTDNDGNIYTTGYFGGTVDFDPGRGVFNLTVPFYSFTPFMSKLDSSGNFIWAKKDIGNCSFAVDQFQNIITFTGNFAGLLTKYDSGGNTVWTKTTAGSPYSAYQNSSIILDAADNIYLTGKFRNTQDFDPGPGVFNLTATGDDYESDVFICRLSADGDFGWAVRFGGYAEDYAHSIVVDNSGNVYTAGVYYNTVDFDPGPGVYTLEPGIAGGGIFIHKMASCLNKTFSVQSVNQCNAYTLNNIIYAKSGTYVQTIPNAAGCDSSITLHLNIGASSNTFSATACTSYTFNNKLYTLNGIYKDTLLTAGGCDSIITLNLTVQKKSGSTITAAICDGQNYSGYSLPGIYYDTFVGANGCDSIRILNLTVQQRKFSTVNYTICQDQSYLGHSSTGTYTDTFSSTNGCDSIRTLNLIVNPKYQFNISKTICEGKSYLGHSLPGNYSDILHTQNGCDSIINSTIKVIKLPVPTLGAQKELCINDSILLNPGIYDSYLWQDGSIKNVYTVHKPGTYSLVATNICGTGYAEINIVAIACQIYFANAFTPNSDGKNDVFKILNAHNITDYKLSVYNRYGNKIFETTDYLKGWDGNNNNQPANTDVYVWKCSFKENNIIKHIKGTVLLLK